MKKDRLKPYVHKVKGAVNYALYDMMNGRFFHLKPEGDVQTLRENLKNAGLIFETEGEVPCKIEFDIPLDAKNIRLRNLQIKLNGEKEDNCWQRNKLPGGMACMEKTVLEALEHNLAHIPLYNIRIEADAIDKTAIENIITHYKCFSVELCTKKKLDKETSIRFFNACEKRDIQFTVFTIDSGGKKDMEKLVTDPYHFFYSRNYNSCFGEQVAVDVNGDIKPCLWSDDILGNVLKDNLKDMIISGRFNRFWEITKDHIQICSECEKRYACNDCRVSAVSMDRTFEGKPGFCHYNPFNGEGNRQPGN